LHSLKKKSVTNFLKEISSNFEKSDKVFCGKRS